LQRLNVLALVPTSNIKEQFSEIAKENDDLTFQILVGETEENIRYIQNSCEDFDVILSGKSTIELLRHVTAVPMVEIGISFPDVLRSILIGMNYKGKFAIVGRSSVTNIAQMICDLLQLRFDIITETDNSAIHDRLEKIKLDGYSMVIGDDLTASIARDIGLSCVPITVGNASVSSAVEQAKLAAETCRLQNQKLNIIQSALSASEFLIVVMNEDGSILYSSSSNPEFDPAFDFLKLNLPSKIPNKLMVKLDSHYWSFDKHTVNIEQDENAVCFYIRKQPYDLEDIAMRGITVATHSELAKHEISEGYLDSSPYTHKIVDDARNYAKSHFPILIVGEPGVGKNIIANIIHHHSHYSENHVVVGDCSIVELPTWTKLLHETPSILSESDVVFFFKNIEQTPIQIQDTLIAYLQSMHERARNKFLFSCNCGEDNKIPDQPLISFLQKSLQAPSIYVPPLREQVDEIGSLSSLYINSLSVELGSQVIGLEPNAIPLLKEYSWPGNLNQFRRFISELIVSTHGYYILAETVESELKREISRTSDKAHTSFGNIELQGNLDDIIRQIILQILHEENQNQTKAAQRLNISRSTLWRKLKLK